MMEIGGAIIAAIAEVVGWLLIQLAIGLVSLIWLMLVAGARFAAGTYRIARRLLTRHSTERELAQVALEYHAALADIKRISADTRRQIRRAKEGGRRDRA